MAFTVSKLGGASASSNPLGSGTFSAPTAGDLLICIGSTGNNDGTQQVTSVTDSASGTWTEISAGAGSQHDVKWWYKVSDGTETSVSVNYGTSTGNDMLVLRVTGWVNTPTLEDFDEFEGNLETADADGSVAAGTVTNATASALIVAIIASDALGTVTDSGAMSDGSAYSASGDQGTQLYAFHREVSSTGTYSPVYTYSDTGDQVYAASAVFGDAVAGGSIESGAGSSAGTSTASGVGASTAAAAGSAEGDATAVGAGASIAAATGTSAGSATASGVGDSAESGVESGAGSAAGTSTAAGVGASTAAAAGESDGSSTAEGAGASIAAAAGESAGEATAEGAGGTAGDGSGDSIDRGGRFHGAGMDIRNPRHPYWRNRIEEEEPDPSDAAPPPHAPSPAKPSVAKQRATPRRSRASSPGAEITRALLGVTDTPISPPLIGVSSGTPVAAAPVSPSQVHDDDDDVEALLLLALID